MFLAPKFFLGGAPPERLEWDYKIQPGSDHVAKFHGDRSRELGERLAKQKNIWGKTEARPELIVPGGLTSPARFTQLVQPSLAFCFSVQPMTAHRPVHRYVIPL